MGTFLIYQQIRNVRISRLIHTPGMTRPTNRSRLLIATLCVAVVALRVAGLHVHLCMDGSEAPLSIHVADSGVHHLDEADAGKAHADFDMAIASDVVVKKPFGDFDLSLLVAFCALLLFVLARLGGRPFFPPFPICATSARAHLRPPLRGPPRLT